MGNCAEILKGHASLSKRKQKTSSQLESIRSEISGEKIFNDDNLMIYAAGSLGRHEVGTHSDLDVFVISGDDEYKRLEEIRVFSKLIEINDRLKYPNFSNDGQFLKIYLLPEMRKAIGAPRDDHENLFTARMLLLLESEYLSNNMSYKKFQKEIVSDYFRDAEDHPEFKPLFLLNDLLRYWRTLCLNYENIRHDTERAWRKKNVNLKFARMLTVYATIIPLIAGPITTMSEFMSLVKLTPLERLAIGLDVINDRELNDNFEVILDDYEVYLSWKENDEIEKLMMDDAYKRQAEDAAKRFSDFLYAAIEHTKIDREMRKFLVI